LTPDFYGRTSLLFDGSTLNMPDTESNQTAFGKHTTQHGAAGFPQLRLMALVVGATHFVLDVAFAAIRGKGTGEHSLMREILQRLPWRQWLLLVDMGLYSFALLWTVQQRHEHFLLKVKPGQLLTPLKGSAYRDGSYLAVLTGKVDGVTQSLTVRVIDCHLRGFPSFRLLTNLLDPAITARELVRHYHQRWEIEIAFDEIKTHQAATLRGQSPTVLRSKRADLVKQELYALCISYNGLRVLMQQAAAQSGQAPTELSFLQTFQAVIDAVPYLNWRAHPRSRKQQRRYLLTVIAESEIKYARRPRINPRVVKVRASKFARKTAVHQGEKRDFEKDLVILATHGRGKKRRPRWQAA
jgi:hypothetical protein